MQLPHASLLPTRVPQCQLIIANTRDILISSANKIDNFFPFGWFCDLVDRCQSELHYGQKQVSVMSLPATAQLSCQNCTRRKTKCDKKLPSCSACIKIGTACTVVQRQRLPRGRSARHAKSSSEQVLRDRVDHLESIVSRLQQGQSTIVSDSVGTSSRQWSV